MVFPTSRANSSGDFGPSSGGGLKSSLSDAYLKIASRNLLSDFGSCMSEVNAAPWLTRATLANWPLMEMIEN